MVLDELHRCHIPNRAVRPLFLANGVVFRGKVREAYALKQLVFLIRKILISPSFLPPING